MSHLVHREPGFTQSLRMLRNYIFPLKSQNRCHLHSDLQGVMTDPLQTPSKASTQPDLPSAQKEPAILKHDVPLPQDIEKSKLDWLLQINEQFFEAELRTVVSSFLIYIFGS